MMIKCLVIGVVLVLAASPSSTMGAYEIAKPGCPDECGGVKIPFPFCLGSPDCYLTNTNSSFPDTTYLIKCDHTTSPPTPFITDGNMKLLSINVEDHSLRISSGAAFECYNITNYTNDDGIYVVEPSSNPHNNTYYLPDMWSLNISATRNRFVAIGCDTTARVWDGGNFGGGEESIGCMTSCWYLLELIFGSTFEQLSGGLRSPDLSD